MTTIATPGLIERLREGTTGTDIAKTDPFLNAIMREAADEIERLRRDLAFTDQQSEKVEALLEPHVHWDGQPAPAGGEVRALRKALEPFADAVHGLSDRVADDAAILLTIDGRPVVTFAWVKAGDFRRAGKALASPAEAAQAGALADAMATGLGIMRMNADGALEHLPETEFRPIPSREEVPTDEQVERAQSARIDYMTRNGQGYTSDAAMRAALKAAGPSAQQRVSEEMVERARKNLAASGIWVSAHGVMQVLDAALSPENGGA